MSVAPSLAAFSLASFLAFSIPVDAARLPQPGDPCTCPTKLHRATEISSASATLVALAEGVVAQFVKQKHAGSTASPNHSGRIIFAPDFLVTGRGSVDSLHPADALSHRVSRDWQRIAHPVLRPSRYCMDAPPAASAPCAGARAHPHQDARQLVRSIPGHLARLACRTNSNLHINNRPP